MFIYIDESGSFAHSQKPKRSYSCVGALTIPEIVRSSVYKGFKKLQRNWGLEGREIKGRELNEGQVAQTINLLLEYGVKFHVCVTDMYYNPTRIVAISKDEQARRLLVNLTDQHHPDLVAEMKEMSERLKALPDQLYIQLAMMTELVHYQLRDMLIYLALKIPKELKNFHWTIDRKGKELTIYEELWKDLVCGFIQGRQVEHRGICIACVDKGNYKYFRKFCGIVSTWPEHLPDSGSGLREKSNIPIINIKKIMQESFTLADSRSEIGLQLADIITNALRRAIIGNLQRKGWEELGRLMFRWGNSAVNLMHFDYGNRGTFPVVDLFGREVITAIDGKARFITEG
ncbi:MAG: DUF3800 domain-containing protein [Candidatus Aureabacteria bacterium]|nr:DUF3800 domain-containing protein [Candidatus Auribacterota bacterium]